MNKNWLFAAGLAAAFAACGPSASQAQNASAPTSATARSDGIAALRTIASQSQCAAHNWAARGRAPRSYIEGVTLVFARSVCQPQRADVQVVSAPVDTSANSDDALAVYRSAFQASGMQTTRPVSTRSDTATRF